MIRQRADNSNAPRRTRPQWRRAMPAPRAGALMAIAAMIVITSAATAPADPPSSASSSSRSPSTPPAPTSKHWAFAPVHRPPLPAVTRRDWVRTAVDAFVAAGHERHHLTPSPSADRYTLIRRLSLDLTGLPPTLQEVDAFVNDPSPRAYEQLVDRLLASPAYGQRWGRHWLDVARYADTEGYESNHPRLYMWRYRDYVVDAFNADKPYDQFVREQVAGDEIEPYADEHLIATGFLSNARLSSNEEDKAMQRNDVLIDVVNATSSALLGLTMGCAQCHDHKFDPITQRDYYSFEGFFVKGQPNNLVLKSDELWEAFNAAKAPEYDHVVALKELLYQRGIDERNQVVRKEFSPEQLEALKTPDARRTHAQRELARRASLRMQATPGEFERFIPNDDKPLYNELKKRLADMKKKMPDEPQVWGFYSPATSPTHVDVLPMKAFYPLPYDPAALAQAAPFLLVRGDVHQRGDALSPAWPAVLGPPPNEQEQQLIARHPRTALADWLTRRDNPLVARVWVNRIWHYHFGRGIVATPGDFGVKGDPPTLAGVLDWLAAELIEHGWSTKHIHRLILLSSTYRQSSRVDGANAAASADARIDPDNTFLWHWQSRRLESEAIRDAVLAVSGDLDSAPYAGRVPIDEADASLRRSIYLEQKRDAMPALQNLFDGPTALESCSRRHTSTVALQPLYLLNSAFMLDRAASFARRVQALAGDDVNKQIDIAFRIALSRHPDAADRKNSLDFIQDARNKPAAPAAPDAPPTYLIHFCHALLNLDEFLYPQ